MDELAGKVITGIIIAILIFALESLGVRKLILGMVSGTSSPMLEELINGSSKNEGVFWSSVEKCGKDECYQLYLDKYPQGNFASIAKVQLKEKKGESKLALSRPVVKRVDPPKHKPDNKRIEHYKVYDNGTALDTQRNLLWMRCSIGQTWGDSSCSGKVKYFSWEDAKKQSTIFTGYSDWRLPTIEELRSLVYCSNGKPNYFSMGKNFDKANNDSGCMGESERSYKDHKSPTILQHIFPNTDDFLYWSSSEYYTNSYGWNVDFRSGDGSTNFAGNTAHVRLVRDGQ